MSNELKTVKPLSPQTLEGLILQGDLGKLSPQQRVEYVTGLCERLGLDPATQPLQLLTLQGKTVAYAGRGCAAQLNMLHGLSHQVISAKEEIEGLYVVNDRCTGPDGRFTEEVGCVSITGLKGEALSNAIMKCRTKAMRRATLTHVGLGFLDESEVDGIPNAKPVAMPKPERAEVAEIVTCEWEDHQILAAKQTIMDYREDLDNAGLGDMTDDETARKYEQLIGDPETSFDNWMNRVFNNCQARLRKAGK